MCPLKNPGPSFFANGRSWKGTKDTPSQIRQNCRLQKWSTLTNYSIDRGERIMEEIWGLIGFGDVFEHWYVQWEVLFLSNATWYCFSGHGCGSVHTKNSTQWDFERQGDAMWPYKLCHRNIPSKRKVNQKWGNNCTRTGTWKNSLQISTLTLKHSTQWIQKFCELL